MSQVGGTRPRSRDVADDYSRNSGGAMLPSEDPTFPTKVFIELRSNPVADIQVRKEKHGNLRLEKKAKNKAAYPLMLFLTAFTLRNMVICIA